ncbi:MAG: hypothetical protein HY776_06210, partial [Actinobacteria bacterium]|nr:hypothetical protein [Actinomycetota bacterium]
MAGTEPTVHEWKELYDTAINFKQNECWNYMWDSDLFGVQNPETREIGYCCIMGRNGEHFALGVYKGSEGLDGLLKIFNAEVDTKSIDTLHVQNCIMASFEDRKFLDKNDHEIIKKLDLKFRGQNSWPFFRDYTPGFHPWYLNSKDVRFLTLALNQSIEISKRMKENPEMLKPKDDSVYLVRVPYVENDEIKWKDEWLEPVPISREIKSVDLAEDPNYIKCFEKIKKGKKKCMDTWEIGVFYSPQGVQESSERPYYPKTILYADHNSEMILSFFISQSI